MTIGKNIEQVRLKLRLSQSEMGRAVGISQSRLSKIERDEGEPSCHQLIAIADLAGISIDELLRGEPRATAATIHPTIADLLSRMSVDTAIRRLSQTDRLVGATLTSAKDDEPGHQAAGRS